MDSLRGLVREVLVSDSINQSLPCSLAESTTDIYGQSIPGLLASM